MYDTITKEKLTKREAGDAIAGAGHWQVFDGGRGKLAFGGRGSPKTPAKDDTSWAGQEALTATISQYHTQFLEFGSEILTRDLEHAEQNILQVGCKKKKSCPPTAGPKFLLKLEAGKNAKKRKKCISVVSFF